MSNFFSSPLISPFAKAERFEEKERNKGEVSFDRERAYFFHPKERMILSLVEENFLDEGLVCYLTDNQAFWLYQAVAEFCYRLEKYLARDIDFTERDQINLLDKLSFYIF